MCGILGIFSFESKDYLVNPNLLEKMRDEMLHRGPDDKGIWISNDNKVGLGHRRLSIIDLSEKANQPMSNEDNTIWVVFNGEIYNFFEIRKELETNGKHIFKTDHSDTEVIVHAFEEWGIDCVKKFRGMFAIAVFDLKRKELWLIRDRVGKKPIYYHIDANRVIFASEIKALLQDSSVKREVDEESFFHYLSFLTTPSPNTLFKGIKKVRPASYIKIVCNGSVEEKKYWDLWDNVTPLRNVSEDEVTDNLIFLLRESVRIRKISDVPVGVFLSGGIDSSLNAVLFAENSTNKVKTFSIGYEGSFSSYKNELEYARIIANQIKSEHYELLLNVDDLINFLPQMVYLQDEPIADPVCFPLYFVSQLARQNGVIVCQIGEGSDELFCGYNSWKRKIILEDLNEISLFNPLKTVTKGAMEFFNKDKTFYYEWLVRGIKKQPIFWGGAEAFPDVLKKRILSDRLANRFKNYTSFGVIEGFYNNFLEKAWEKSPLNWMTYLDLNIRLPELLLMRVDKMTMGVSLEARAPFLDHKLIEYVMGIPTALKFKNYQQKYILKKAVKNLLPKEIIDRKKQGFGVPIYEWFFSKLKDVIIDEIRFFSKNEDFFNIKEIETTVMKNPEQMWFLYNFVLWWKKFIYE